MLMQLETLRMRWATALSVIVEEPSNYTSGTVSLQNVSTYNFFVFLHQFVARSDSSECTQELNNDVPSDLPTQDLFSLYGTDVTSSLSKRLPENHK